MLDQCALQRSDSKAAQDGPDPGQCRGRSACHAEPELQVWTIIISHSYFQSNTDTGIQVQGSLTRGSRAQNIKPHSKWGKYPGFTKIAVLSMGLFASTSLLKKVSWIKVLRVHFGPQISQVVFLKRAWDCIFVTNRNLTSQARRLSCYLSSSKFTHCSIFVLYLKFISRVEQFLFSLMALSRIID